MSFVESFVWIDFSGIKSLSQENVKIIKENCDQEKHLTGELHEQTFLLISFWNNCLDVNSESDLNFKDPSSKSPEKLTFDDRFGI